MDADKVKPGEYVVRLLEPSEGGRWLLEPSEGGRWWAAAVPGVGVYAIPSAALIRRVDPVDELEVAVVDAADAAEAAFVEWRKDGGQILHVPHAETQKLFEKVRALRAARRPDPVKEATKELKRWVADYDGYSDINLKASLGPEKFARLQSSRRAISAIEAARGETK
jgi:hypothetical protein